MDINRILVIFVKSKDFVAQLVEQYTFNVRVPSSNLGGVTNAPLAQLVQSISFTPRGSEVRILQGAHMVDIAQLVRASDCGSEGRGFDSHYSPNKVLYPSGSRGRSAKALFVSSNLTGTSNLTTI